MEKDKNIISKMDHSKMDHSSRHHDANPSMGMEGHDHHAMMINDFKRRFFIPLILTIPIMLLSPMIQQWLGVNWQFIGSGYILFVLSSIVYLYGGWPFLNGWYHEQVAHFDRNPMFFMSLNAFLNHSFEVAHFGRNSGSLWAGISKKIMKTYR